MKIWFGATSLKIEEYYPYYKAICDFLKEKGNVILFDWIKDAYEYKLLHPFGSRNIRDLYRKVLQAINEADLCVIEYTVPNFSSSHQIMYAIHQKKPTLVMRLRKDNSFADSYIEALESPFLTIENYTPDNYKEVIVDFIGYSQIEPGLGRYNIVLDKKQKYYLDWVAGQSKVSRSETIRKAIDGLINRDKKYRIYLRLGKKED